MKDTCINCGGWRGLHKWDTMQCPHNGEENNIWMDTHYQEEDNRIVELQAEVEAIKKTGCRPAGCGAIGKQEG